MLQGKIKIFLYFFMLFCRGVFFWGGYGNNVVLLCWYLGYWMVTAEGILDYWLVTTGVHI